MQNIISLLEYCAAAYTDILAIEPNEKLIKINDKKNDVQGFIRINNDTATIIFRGTDSIKDFFVDINYFKQVYPYDNKNSKIKVHSGFINAYKAKKVRGTVHSFITSDIHKIILTGHSYGAALAVLCAVDLQYNFPDIDYTVVLFGCPKIGNRHFSVSYNKRLFKTIRVENVNDPIPKLPFGLLGYYHVGVPFRLGYPDLLIHTLKNHSLQYYLLNILKRNCSGIFKKYFLF